MLEAYIKEKRLMELEPQLTDNTAEVRIALEKLGNDQPFSAHAAIMLARCQALEGNPDEAKQTMEDVLSRDADHIEAKVQLAKILHAENDMAGSTRLLTEVTHARPEIIENWQLLAEYLKQDGQDQGCENALAQYEMIKAFNDQLNLAEKAFFKAEFVRADNICRKLLEKVPGEVRVLRLLARLAREFRHYEVSLSILTRCVEVRPKDTVMGLDYAYALLHCKQFHKALDQCDKLIELAPEDINVYSLKAEVLFNLGRYEEAIEIFSELSNVLEKPELCLTYLGKLLKIVGKTDQAIQCFHRAVEGNPKLGQAYWELANLKTYRFSEDETSSMKQVLESEDLAEINRVLIGFALGKALEDSGEFADSFEHYASANQAYSKIRPYRYSSQNKALKAFFSQAYFTGQRLAGSDSEAPIFVVGLPRSGSTLVEQIITSHSQVDSTSELTGIASISRRLNASSLPGKGQYPDSIAKLGTDQIVELAEEYLDNAKSFGDGAPYFVDKAPANFHHIGLIKTLFPKAKIIDIRRNPMASGWSIFRHFFDDSFLFSNSLASIGKYYNDYVELMEHWHRVLPGEILTINYEDLVMDLPGHVNRILQYCDLEFEEACLNFHLNERAVATPSSEQVRQPIFHDALEHWKNYEQFLSPLRQAIKQ